jgi:hypothetical protein
MRVKQLSPNPDNPRLVTPAKLEALKRSLAAFGDLSGFVFNVQTKRLVSGHQRVKALPEGAIVIERRLAKPTKAGTLAEGYATVKGERFKYREVDWDPVKEKAASIAANRTAGDWDFPKLSGWLAELEENGLDVSLTLFDNIEIKDIKERVGAVRKALKSGVTSDKPKAAKTKKRIECPDCGHRFVPGWTEDKDA